MARKPPPKVPSEPVPTKRMLVVLVAGVAAAIFATGLAISAAYDRTQRDRAPHGSVPSASSQEIEIEVQPAPP